MTIADSEAALAEKIKRGVATAKAEAIAEAKRYTDQQFAAARVTLTPEVMAYIDQQIGTQLQGALDGIRNLLWSEP